jgi:small conductance mechanosensitive channel
MKPTSSTAPAPPTTDPTTDPSTVEGGLLQEVENEVKVVLDRWSIGQIDWSDLVIAVAVLVGAVALAWIVRRLLKRSARRMEGVAASAVGLVGQLASIGIYLFAGAIVLEVLGFTLGPVLIVILLVVLLVIALRPVLQNLSSGLLLQLRGLCHPGDLVEIDGVIGVVREVTTRAVLLVTADGRLVSVPNDRVVGDRLVNYSREGRRRSNIVLRMPGHTDVVALDALLVPVIGELDAVLVDPSPQVLVSGFDGREVWIEVRYWHEPSLGAETAARDAVGRLLLETFDSDAVTLADPSYAVKIDGRVGEWIDGRIAGLVDERAGDQQVDE